MTDAIPQIDSYVRVGIGFDVHKFDIALHEENYVKLGGVKIPYYYKLVAHSDGDVLLHALTDALLGSMALGDIGDHFPPEDGQWQYADSAKFLEHALELVKSKGGTLINVDNVIIAEKPKLMGYKKKIEESIANLLNIDLNRVSVKATTTEKLGFTGRSEGIAVQSICSVMVKNI